MTPDDENASAVAEDEAADADFASAFAGEEKRKAEPEPAATPRAKEKVEAEPAPEYVQITAKDWAEVRAAAAKTASYDQQLSKAFGTIGNLQKLISGLQADTPKGRKVEIPADAFADMERDFPELAKMNRSALERVLAGITGTGASDADPAKLEQAYAQFHAKRELHTLEQIWPDWRQIVGAVDATREQPDPNNPFRKWLGGKDAAYQERINSSESAAVIDRAIRDFRRETRNQAARPTATTPRSDPKADARAERMKAAIQPRGDRAGPAAPSEDDEFTAGFNSAR